MSPVAHTRNAARRAVLALVAIGVVLVAGAWLPLEDEPGTSWAYLVPVVLFVGHSVLGVVVLVEAVRVVAWSSGLGGRSLVQAAAGGLVCLVAVGTGAVSMAGEGPEEVRPVMALAWVVGLAVYARLWWWSTSVLVAAERQRAPGA